MSCWFGFPPPEHWTDHGLAPCGHLGSDDEPVPLDTPVQETVVELDERVNDSPRSQGATLRRRRTTGQGVTQVLGASAHRSVP